MMVLGALGVIIQNNKPNIKKITITIHQVAFPLKITKTITNKIKTIETNVRLHINQNNKTKTKTKPKPITITITVKITITITITVTKTN